MTPKSAPFRNSLALAFLMSVCWAAAAQASAPSPAALKTSATERAAIEAAFARADTNNDGKLSRDEAQRLPAIFLKFDELDKDKDGFLSLEEFAVGAMEI
jgi:Ca2+-binding EF-hand superfamily protein